MGLRCDGVEGVMGRRRPFEAIMGAAGKAVVWTAGEGRYPRLPIRPA